MKQSEKLVDLNFYLKLLKSIKRSIREVQGPEDKEIKAYYKEYAKFLEKANEKECDKEAIFESLKKRRILLIGDFHTLDEAQNQFIEIIDFLLGKKIKPIIMLEMILKKHNNYLKAFLDNLINEKEFLYKIDYLKSWGFDFNSYGKILNFVKQNKLKCYGINFEGDLKERDTQIALEIKKIMDENSKDMFVVLIGDLHIALNHIPLELNRMGIKPAILFQNSESVIIKRLKKNQNPYRFFCLDEDVYLVNNTPPWIKMQSYLTYLEHPDESYFLKYGYSPSEDEFDFSVTVQNYIKALKDIFNLHQKKDDDFVVYTMKDLSFLADSYFKKGDGKVYAEIIKNDRSLFLTHQNIIYTVYPDVNHTLEEAMHYLMGKDLPIGDDEGSFWERIHYFMAGYIASKVINPLRKTYKNNFLVKILEKLANTTIEKDKKYLRRQITVYMALSNFLELFRKKGLSDLVLNAFIQIDRESVFELSRNLGYQAGEVLYEEYTMQRLSGRDIKHLIFKTSDYKSCCYRLFDKYIDMFLSYYQT